MLAARAQLPCLEDGFARGEFQPLTRWLNEKVHRPGRRYRSDDLCRRVTGEGLRHEPLIGYLRDKYAPLYQL